MSLLHPNDDDDAFAAGHTEAALRKSLNRSWRLTALLHRVLALHGARQHFCRLPPDLALEIEEQVTRTHYDERDDGEERLEREGIPLPPQKARRR